MMAVTMRPRAHPNDSDSRLSAETAETRTLPDLAHRCKEETERYLRREPYAECYALELFRRAIVQQDNDAWTAIYTQYADVVRRWLSARSDEHDELVVVAFERFWHAVDAEKFARFGSLAAVLQYLKLCAHTTRLDRIRSARVGADEETLDESRQALLSAQDDVSETVAARVDARAFWNAVQACLPDQRERQVLYLSYVMGLTPREICTRHEDTFPDVSDVYRLKRNALDRLRRASRVRDLL
jgi:RNA polymerase sigma factor (sigma-70 family)